MLGHHLLTGHASLHANVSRINREHFDMVIFGRELTKFEFSNPESEAIEPKALNIA